MILKLAFKYEEIKTSYGEVNTKERPPGASFGC